jgi:cell division protein FtsN
VAGILLGGFGVGLLWLQFDPGLRRSGSGLADTGVPRPQADETKRAPASATFEFEFPELLSTMEVLVPDEEPAEAPRAQTRSADVPAPASTTAKSPSAAPRPAPTPLEKPAAASAPREAYLLQIGSFRDASDAERLKARLALMGVETRIQKVTIDNKDTFHRVRSGPYRSQKQLDEVRRLLGRNNIKSIVIKWKG